MALLSLTDEFKHDELRLWVVKRKYMYVSMQRSRGERWSLTRERIQYVRSRTPGR